MKPCLVNGPSPANIALIDNACIPMIARMQAVGCCVNRDALSDLHKFFESERTRITDLAESSCGIRFNLGSDDQVRKVLFKELRLDKLKRESTGRRVELALTPGGEVSTGKLELEKFAGVHPIVNRVLQYRQVDKLDSSYAVALMQQARKCADGAYRIFYTIKPYSTDTGRFAGEDPNPMVAPVRTALGRRIKACFVASPGCRLIECDFSQIEMRVAAHESQGEFLTRMFREGRDVHTNTAMLVYKLPEDQIHEMRHRYPMKRAGFLILYLGNGYALHIQLNSADAQDPDNPHVWTEDECDRLIEEWYGVNPEMRDWQDEQFARMYRTGMVWTLFGRIRPMPEMLSVHSWIRNKGKRQGANHPIQGGAADLFRMALAALDDAYQLLRLHLRRVEALIPIHDAVLAEADEDFAEDVARVTKEEMENVAVLRVPIKADAKVGPTGEAGWSELKKLREAA